MKALKIFICNLSSMKKSLSYLLVLSIAVVSFACTSSKTNTSKQDFQYKPDDQALYDTIVHLDSLFFHAYNTCDVNLATYSDFYAEDLEFYHDQGGFSNSKAETVESTKKNVCGKVTRELVKGSIEVYPIKNFGAIEMGLHRFKNNTQAADVPSEPGKFVIIWQNKNNEWKISRVISLH